MRSHQLHLEQYQTDKIVHHYLEQYDTVFKPWVDREIVLLELGIHKGGSLLLWRDYFLRGKIVGPHTGLVSLVLLPLRLKIDAAVESLPILQNGKGLNPHRLVDLRFKQITRAVV